MKITRMGGLMALLAVGALTLSACGSDNNTASSTTVRRGRRIIVAQRRFRRRFGHLSAGSAAPRRLGASGGRW